MFLNYVVKHMKNFHKIAFFYNRSLKSISLEILFSSEKHYSFIFFEAIPLFLANFAWNSRISKGTITCYETFRYQTDNNIYNDIRSHFFHPHMYIHNTP